MKIINLVIAMCLFASTCCAETYNEQNNNVSSVEIKFLDLDWYESKLVTVAKLNKLGFKTVDDGAMTKTVNGYETAILPEFIDDKLVRVVINIETNSFEKVFKFAEADFSSRYGAPALMVRDASLAYKNDYFNEKGIMNDEIIVGNSHIDRSGNILAYGSYSSLESGISFIMSFESSTYLAMDEDLEFAAIQDQLIDSFLEN